MYIYTFKMNYICTYIVQTDNIIFKLPSKIVLMLFSLMLLIVN